MYLPTETAKLFCLEGVRDERYASESRFLPMLEQLVLQHGVVNVHKTFDSIENFEESLNVLLYDDNGFKDYELIYLICSGAENQIEIDGYAYNLEEIAELFEGKLKGKIVHFANGKALNIDTETSQYFIDVTGAKALSGYSHNHFVSSALLDFHFFALYQETDDVKEVVETLFQKHYALCTQLGFHLFY